MGNDVVDGGSSEEYRREEVFLVADIINNYN